MKRKNLTMFCCGLMLMTNWAYSQVGINTEKPQTTLDVNGDFQIRGEFRAGSSAVDSIAAGKPGQYLMSQGSGLPPTWGNPDIPQLNTGDYVLKDTQFAEDRDGLAITTLSNSSVAEGTLLDSQWSVLEGLTTNITTTKDKNRVMFTCQTVMQSPFEDPTDGNANWASALCGIFIGSKGSDRSTFKLIAVRQGSIQGGHYPQLPFTLVSSHDDLAKGQYEVVVAYQRRGGTAPINALPLYFGQGFTTTPVQVTNNFMNKSVIRVDVFEPESEEEIIGG